MQPYCPVFGSLSASGSPVTVVANRGISDHWKRRIHQESGIAFDRSLKTDNCTLENTCEAWFKGMVAGGISEPEPGCVSGGPGPRAATRCAGRPHSPGAATLCRRERH